jgi:hypothetical protein
VVAVFACAQFLGGTTSSFSDTTASTGNTVTASADWTAPTISAVVLQKSEGGVINNFHANETFYIYASVADTGNPAAGIGTITANTTNIATVSSETLTSGSWTVSGTTYNYRTALLTAKSTLLSQSYSYSLSVSDSAGNGPTTSSPNVTSSNVTLAPSSFHVLTAGKPVATDKITFTYSSAPDPDSIFDGWDGTSRTVDVKLADGAVYSMSSLTQDVVGIADSAGNVTSLGYIVTGGDYVATGTTVSFANSTIALSGSVYTVTLGTPSNSANLKTDSTDHPAIWYSYATAFDTFGNASSAATITGISRIQF